MLQRSTPPLARRIVLMTAALWFCLGYCGTGWLSSLPAQEPPAASAAAVESPASTDDDGTAEPLADQAGKGAVGEADKLVKELSDGRVGKFIERFTYLAIVGVLLLCGMGLPLPEEVPILTSGVLASTGHLSPWPALSAVMFGVMLGDSVMFLLGQRWGSHVFEHRMARKLVTPERHRKIVEYFGRYGAWIIFAARFLPGLRAPLFLTAGSMKVPFWVFFSMDGAAALLSIPISFYVAYKFTDKLTEMLDASHQILYWAIGAILLFSIGGHWLWSWLRRKRKASVQEAVGAPVPVDTNEFPEGNP